MNTRRHNIVPPASLVAEVRSGGSVVVCRSGAIAGARVHFTAPTGQGFTGEHSEPLVNGQAYLAPVDRFDRFWVTWASPLPTSPESLELLVIDCAQPVVVLNTTKAGGFRSHAVGGATIAEIQGPAATTLYTDAAPGQGLFLDSTLSVSVPRGFIGGGIVADEAIKVTIFARLAPSTSTFWCQLAQWECDQADELGKFSASFEFGGQTKFRTTSTFIRSGATLLPWPAFGLRLDVIPLTGGPPVVANNVRWALYERTEA